MQQFERLKPALLLQMVTGRDRKTVLGHLRYSEELLSHLIHSRQVWGVLFAVIRLGEQFLKRKSRRNMITQTLQSRGDGLGYTGTSSCKKPLVEG